MTARLLAAVALACSLAPGLAAAQAAAAAAPAASAPVKSVPAAASAPVTSVPAASAPVASAPAAAVSAAAEAPASVAVVAAPAPAPVATLPSAAVPATPGPMAGPSAGNLLQTIFALTLVLALLGAMVWFMKRFGPQAAAGAAQMRTIGALSLGGRERVIVIEVGDQWIVVGASPGRINALATMPKQESAGGPAVLANGPASGTFAEWLKQTIDKRNGR
ncbi:flagellar biosynthetic protein FliO [Massilia rubra]|uniref:Flagellar protein n=1 Tax=Massilia rubra TaxID=2607910 RepID=A0ABX0LXV3_9BURK|nr:flagellar biosynthetic protein FliO [Massilia rubra]NHZ37578.1 flagellar biosynthetic protein FliO [Massilia rubra]